MAMHAEEHGVAIDSTDQTIGMISKHFLVGIRAFGSSWIWLG